MAKTRTIKIDVSPMYRAMIYMVRNEPVPDELIAQFTGEGEQAELRQYNSDLRLQHWHVREPGALNYNTYPSAGNLAFGTQEEAEEFENKLWDWYGGEEAGEDDAQPHIKVERCLETTCKVYVG